MRLDQHYRWLMMVCVLLGLCCIASHASPSPGSSTPERCHPEDVLLLIQEVNLSGRVAAGDLSRRVAAGRAAQVDKFVRGVYQGARYEASWRLVKLGLTVHEEWRQFHGAVEQDDQAQRISFAVPPLPAGRYVEHFEVYDACGLSESLSTYNEDDGRLRLLSKLNIVVDVEEAEKGDSIYRVSVPHASAEPLPESSVCKVQTFRSCNGTYRPDETRCRFCAEHKAEPRERCQDARTSPLFALYVLNVPGEDDRWRRMLHVLEESFLPPGLLVHRFDTVPLDDYRVVEYPENQALFEHISSQQRYSNLLSHVDAWQHFATDADAADNDWALFFEDDIVVHAEVRGDTKRVTAILEHGFALGAMEGFVYLGLCGMKSAEQVKREWLDGVTDGHLRTIAEGYDTGRLPDGWLALSGPHGPLYLDTESNTYTVHAPLGPGAGSTGDTTFKVAGHGVEHIKGCGTCLHAYGVAKWRAKTLWRQLNSIPWRKNHPVTYPPDSVTLDVYLFQAMLGGVLPMVWNLGANLMGPSNPFHTGLTFQDSFLPGGILY
jgi:hypothetical protein